MPRVQPKKLRFGAYRTFEEARIEANNSMIALLVGTRLAAHTLAAHDGSEVPMPQIYPAVRDVKLLNRTVGDTQAVLKGAESELVFMAIPYVQSVYDVLTNEAVQIMRRAGHPAIAGRNNHLMGRHSYLSCCAGLDFHQDHLDLLDLLRLIRNSIIHDGRKHGDRIRERWNSLSVTAEDRWVRLTGRPLPASNVGERLTLDSRELIASLAVTKRLAREVAGLLMSAVDRSLWTDLAIEDFDETHKSQLRSRPTLTREVFGFVRFNYGPLGLTENEVTTALADRNLITQK